MKTYQQQIGDGKLPNKYFVFHYDEKFKRVRNEDKGISLEIIGGDEEPENSFLGEFKTYHEAVGCFDNSAYLPHSVIEDRLSGQILETLCIVCESCGREDWETYRDTEFTEKALNKKGLKFV